MSQDPNHDTRLAVIADALDQLEWDENLTPDPGTYISTRMGTCSVCMIGGLTLALTAPKLFGDRDVGDGTTYAQLRDLLLEHGAASEDVAVIVEEVFTHDQLGLLEAGFGQGWHGRWGSATFQDRTGRDYHYGYHLEQVAAQEGVTPEELLAPGEFERFELYQRAIAYGKGYRDDLERYRAILVNMQANGGEFIP